MRVLGLADIDGDEAAVKAVHRLFGDVEFATKGPGGTFVNGPPVRLRITRVLPNFYRNMTATPEKDPLYVLVPDTTIEAVWPRNGSDVRYGTASDNNGPVTAAVAIYKETVGLYFCLSPAGERITEIGALGI